MENANKALYWNNPLVRRIDNVWPTRLTGMALIVMLAGLTGFNPLLGITSALVLFLSVLVMSKPILIVYGLTLIFPLAGGLSRGIGVPFLRLPQALLLLGFILFLLAKKSPLGKSRLTAVDLAFVLFFLSEAVFPILALYYRGEHLDLNQIDGYGETPLQILLGPLQYYLLYRIVVATVISGRQIKRVLELIFIASIIVSAIGILEKIIPSFKTFIETYYPRYLPSYSADISRITSTLQHFSGLAAYLAFTIILALACYTVGERLKISPLLLGVTTAFDTITLILTGTFSAWIGLAIGTVIVFILIRRIPKLVIFLALGIILAAIIFQSFLSTRLNEELGVGSVQGLVPQSFAFRIQLWQELFLPAISHQLLFGYGPAPAVLNNWSTEETQYLFLLLRGGLSYFLSYILLIGVAMAACWQQMKSKIRNPGYPIALALLVILIMLNIMNVSGEYFTYLGGTQTLWTLLAMVVASRQKAVSSATTEQSQDNLGKVGGKTSYKPLNKMATPIEDKLAYSLPTRNDFSFSPSESTGPYRKVSHPKKTFLERS